MHVQDESVINVRHFGARGDGETDDTMAIRKAIDALPPKSGVLFFPPGHYRSDTIPAPAFTTIMSHSGWSYYGKLSGCVISPISEEQPCLFDARGKRGTRFVGLNLDGMKMGREMHGIITSNGDSALNKSPDNKRGEQNLIIDDCRIEFFSGSGFYGYRAWVWCIRHSIFFANGLDGIDGFSCFDAWVVDSQLSANGRHGMSVESSTTITGNRIEHNIQAGIEVIGPHGPHHLQITGNLFCSNGAPAIEIPGGLPGGDSAAITDPCYAGRENWDGTPGGHARGIAITGNTIRYSGHAFKESDDRSCHVRMIGVEGMTFTGNVLTGYGRPAPSYGMVLERLTDSVIANNSLCRAASRKAIHDKGGHSNVLIDQNVFSLDTAGSDATPESGSGSSRTPDPPV